MALLQQDMESFLPSEVARLVYGYLEEEECTDAAQAFLETSMHLKECLAVAKKGRKFSTKIYGLSLIDLFDLLSEAICFVKENSKALRDTTNMGSRLFSLLLSDGGSADLLKDNNSSEKSEETKDDESVASENRQLKNVNLSKNINNKNDNSHKFIDSENKEAPTFLCTNQLNEMNEKDGFSPHFIKVKEENDMEDCGFDLEDNHDEEDAMPGIEPEVQILSAEGQLRQEPPPTVNVITSPIMVGRPSQLLCQPYGMVHMVPAYPTTGHPSLSTALFMPQQSISAPQHPITVHHSQAIIQATGTAVSSPNNTLPTMWPKPKITTSQNQPAPALKTYKRAADYANAQLGNNKDKICKLKPNMYPSSSKLRPIAPKITQSLDCGVKVQVVHTKENPLVETNPNITKRCLRSRRKSNQKSEHPAAPLFIDIQEIYNEN